MGKAATAIATSNDSEATLLARLGLPANADPQAVEKAHEALLDFLATAPADLRPWARRESDRVDEAFALLSDPTIDRSAAAAASTHAPAARAAATFQVEATESDEWDLESGEPVMPASPTGKRARHGRADATAPAALSEGPSTIRRFRRPALLAAAAVGVLAVVVAVFNMGSGTGIPGVGADPVAGATASPAVDTAKVAALMQKIAADPKDVTSLQSLADIYYLANDFETSAGFLEKIIAIDPKDVTARLALGAAYFNVGKSDLAQTQWRAVIAQEPNNLEAHYDLGFMYLSRDPADLASAKTEWQKVIAIAPDSDVAKTIEQHLASLDKTASPGPSTGTTTPAPSSAPAASAPAVSEPAASPGSGN